MSREKWLKMMGFKAYFIRIRIGQPKLANQFLISD